MLNYNFEKNQKIDKFILSKSIISDYRIDYDTMNYETIDLECGFTMRDYPCRTHFQKNHSLSNVKAHDNIEGKYYILDKERVDLSTFIPVPTYIETYATNYFKTDANELEFVVYTCGGVKIWINDELVDTFEHYKRNDRSKHTFKCNITKEINKLQIYFDELIERDGNYYFEISCDSELEVSLPISVSEVEAKHLINVAENSHFSKTYFDSEDIVIVFPEETKFEFDINLVVKSDFIDAYSYKKQITIPKGVDRIKIDNCNNLKSGYLFFNLSLSINDFNIDYTLACETNRVEAFRNLESGFNFDDEDERKKFFYNLSAMDADNSSHKLISLLETSCNKEQFDVIVKFELNRITRNEDCSDFYLIPFLYIIEKYQDHEFISKDLLENLKEVILNFRFWYDEPGNDVMWWFSENHALLFHVLQYLCGSIYKEEVFVRSGRKGSEQKEIGRIKVIEWLGEFNKGGLTEWNSASYIPIDFIGLATLYNFGDDEIKEKSKIALDLIFNVLAEYSFNGDIFGATQGRAYEKSLCSRFATTINIINWIYTGKGNYSSFTKGNVLLFLSDYQPNKYYLDTINSVIDKTTKQGNGQNVFTRVVKNNKFMISAVLDYKNYELGYQEHIAGVVFGNNVSVWVNHPGELKVIGGNRPSFWGGNGIIPKIEMGEDFLNYEFNMTSDVDNYFPNFTHCYFPTDQFDEFLITENKAWAISNGIQLTIVCSEKLELVKNGPSANCELRAYGKISNWQLKINEVK